MFLKLRWHVPVQNLVKYPPPPHRGCTIKQKDHNRHGGETAFYTKERMFQSPHLCFCAWNSNMFTLRHFQIILCCTPDERMEFERISSYFFQFLCFADDLVSKVYAFLHFVGAENCSNFRKKLQDGLCILQNANLSNHSNNFFQEEFILK